MGKKLISVIVPCYCEEEAIPHYWEETAKVADSMTEVDFEFLFIDDGSKDHTVSILQASCKKRQTCPIRFLFQKFRQRSRHVRRFKKCKGRLCCDNGC